MVGVWDGFGVVKFDVDVDVDVELVCAILSVDMGFTCEACGG